MVGLIVALVIFLILSMFFSSADMALSVNEIHNLEDLVSKKKKGAKTALKVSKNYEFAISTILFGNNLANIGATTITVFMATKLGINNAELVATIILTVFVIIFCEFFPKALTKRFAKSFWLFEAPIVLMFEYIFFIFVWPISKLFSWLIKPLRKHSEKEDEISSEVLEEMVDAGEDVGILEENEAEIVRGAIDLHDSEAYEIMTPRVEMYSIEINETINDILKDPKTFDYSRIPVYEDTVDNIVGILPVKTLLRHVLSKKTGQSIKPLLIKPLFVPRNTNVLDLLTQFKESKIHIAILIDEFGGVDGIVTMEDILELVVGDIFDENDEIEREVIEKKDGTMFVDGSMSINDLFDLIDYDGDFDTAYSTVGGFCQEFLEDFGKVGDTFTFNNYLFKITKMDDFVIERVKIEKLKDSDEDK